MNKRSNKKIKAIECIKNNYDKKTMKEIAKLVNSSISYISTISKSIGIKIEKQRKTDILRQYFATKKQNKTINQIKKDTGFSQTQIYIIAKESNFNIIKLPKINYNHEFIIKNYPHKTMQQIGNELGVSKQYVSQLVQYLKKHELWYNKTAYRKYINDNN